MAGIPTVASAAARIHGYADARDAWRSMVTTTLADDARLDSLIEVGSLGRGGGDALSDVDLVAVPAPEAHLAVTRDPGSLLPPAGQVLFCRVVARNAPAGGAYMGVCYDLHSLPLWTDLYVWPAATVAVPNDAAVVFHRPNRTLPASPMGFVDLLDHTGTEQDGPADDEVAATVLRVIVAAKYLARGDADRLEHQLCALAITADQPTAIAALTATVRHLGQAITLRTIDIVTSWVELAAELCPEPSRDNAEATDTAG